MRSDPVHLSLRRPGKALVGVMVAMTVIWVAFAIGQNWVGIGDDIVRVIVGSTSAVLHGQIWRLFTAPLFHSPQQPWHLLTSLLGLYFLGPTLEERWGPRRTLLFLFGSAAFAFALQVVVGALVPQVHAHIWFGGLGMETAVAVAWALSNRGQSVRMFFMIPVSATALIGIIFVLSLLHVLAMSGTAEGLITPFGGMLGGWLFGDHSPLRRFFLKLRLKKIQAETAAARAQSAARARRASAPFRVIEGGTKQPPKDKRYLN